MTGQFAHSPARCDWVATVTLNERQTAWYGRLPKTGVVALALVTDHDGQVLIVKPTYKEGWIFPGGVVESGEHPARAAARELHEETGLDLPNLGLLTLDAEFAFGDEGSPLLAMVFDFGTVSDVEISLQDWEIAEFRWATPTEAVDLLGVHDRHRLMPALEARRTLS